MRYQNILNAIHETPWMITQEGLDVILSIIDRRMENTELSQDELAAMRSRSEERNELELPDKPSIAVLPIQGDIFPKANLFTAMSGATSIEKLKADFNTLMEHENVSGILLDFDSPGGSASMIKEMADVIYAARESGKKPIYAVANGMCCSAAYYLGSQAEKLYMTDSGVVGSVGVIAVHTDVSQQEQNEGIKRTVLTMGDYKADGHPSIPLTDEVKQRRLDNMKETYDQFVEDVARGRGVTTDDVLQNYGKGGVFYSKKALERGMVDGVKTLESVSAEMLEGMKSKAFNTADRIRGNKSKEGVRAMAEITPETLNVLGLSEEATPEEIFARVTEINTRATAAPPVTDPEKQKAIDFATQFPEQAARIAELEKGRREDAAKIFASGYEKFSNENGETGFGLSGLALQQAETLHLKIADGLVTHEDLKTFLDCVASGNGVVNYKEVGSSRGDETTTAENGDEAAKALAKMAKDIADTGEMSYGDALSKVMKENPSLAEQYSKMFPHPEVDGG